MGVFDPKSVKGPSALDNVKYRFIAITRDVYQAETHAALLLDAVTDEGLSNKADIPLHPTSAGTSISDHAIRGARAYTVSGFIANPLEGDNALPSFLNPADSKRVLFYPEPASGGSSAHREDMLSEALEGFLGVPLNIYSPRFGKLENFAMASYNDQRDGTTRVRVDLSFQEIRIASVEEVVVPKIPKAAAQKKPEENCVCPTETIEVTEPELLEDVSTFLGYTDETNLESIANFNDQQRAAQEEREPIPSLQDLSDTVFYGETR